jgi:hypothetical protein
MAQRVFKRLAAKGRVRGPRPPSHTGRRAPATRVAGGLPVLAAGRRAPAEAALAEAEARAAKALAEAQALTGVVAKLAAENQDTKFATIINTLQLLS